MSEVLRTCTYNSTCTCTYYYSCYRDLDFVPAKPEEDPPVPWWNSLCDVSLLVGIVKHGMYMYNVSTLSTTRLCVVFDSCLYAL